MAVVSIAILSTVQLFLLYNTYNIRNEHYFQNEKQLINRIYSLKIANDKVFPGGANIIDNVLYPNIPNLHHWFRNNKKKFKTESEHLCLELFQQLRSKNNLDSVLKEIVENNKLPSNYKFASTIKSISLAFEPNKYIPIFPFSDEPNTPQDYLVGGDSSAINVNNKVSDITVSLPSPNTYRIEFCLYLNNENRQKDIFISVLPIFSLCVFSILAIYIMFFKTYTNWIKQKKLATMQTDFINSITHELNTPLTAIMVANRGLQNEKIADQNIFIKDLTAIIQRQCIRLKDLFGQVLNLTIVNEANLRKEKINLNNLIYQTISDYKLKIDSTNITIKYTSTINDTDVNLDVFWFTTMLQNIIDNGIKYNEKEEKIIVITLTSSEDVIMLSIDDNGIGMSKKTLSKIFDKFYRHNNTSGKAGGLGLGLFYVKKCVDLHHWSINIKSEEGTGSYFEIKIK